MGSTFVRTIVHAAPLAAALLVCAAARGQADLQLTTQDMNVNAFGHITAIAHTPGANPRMLVAQQNGYIYAYGAQNNMFLNYNLQVSDARGEDGLLGLALAPDYATSGTFYICYNPRPVPPVNATAIIVARGHANTATSIADPASLAVVFNFTYSGQTFHNGGWIGFGPDGLLYLSLGDNGDWPASQNLGSYRGKILRLDVTPGLDDFPADPNRNYHIPPNNPFINTPGALPEILASGLRNPWRCSIDRSTGDLWIGDVGDFLPGEIDFIPAGSPGGQNFGWPCFDAFTPRVPISNCGGNAAALTSPIWTYPESGATIGGYVYRGCAIPAARGLYFFANYGTTRVWALRPTPGSPATPQDVFNLTTAFSSLTAVTCFGEDNAGELYIGTSQHVYKIVPRAGTFPDLNGNHIPDTCDPPFCGIADVAGLGAAAGPDNRLTADDIVGYLDAFFAGRLQTADIAQVGGAPGPDGALTTDDLVAFLNAFFAGCP